MLQGWVIVLVSFAYLGLLFAIATWGDRRAERGRSVIANPTIYALSLAVYCTTWTFYGSVGRGASSGIGFLPVYLGPTLMVAAPYAQKCGSMTSRGACVHRRAVPRVRSS